MDAEFLRQAASLILEVDGPVQSRAEAAVHVVGFTQAAEWRVRHAPGQGVGSANRPLLWFAA